MKAEYLLATADNPGGLPAIVGVLVASGDGGAVCGEAAVGEGEIDFEWVDAAINLLRSLPGPGGASATRWLSGLVGLTNGPIRLTGPWYWDAEDREVLHWALDQVGLTARTVVLIRDGAVSSFPGEE